MMDSDAQRQSSDCGGAWTEVHVTLRDRFQNLCRRTELPTDLTTRTWERLTTRYNEPHRAYHNLAHIEASLALFDSLNTDALPLEWAIWCHDVIYEPLATDNEAASARWFVEAIGDAIPAGLSDAVQRLILATDLRQQRSHAPDEDLMIDIDWSILGTDPEAYRQYAAAIRQEYQMVPDEAFTQGRAEVLGRILKERIYWTPHFAHLEAPARQNLEADRDCLVAADSD